MAAKASSPAVEFEHGVGLTPHSEAVRWRTWAVAQRKSRTEGNKDNEAKEPLFASLSFQ